ncbi:MAG TPA: bifunctional metallophosphatase/5'-nucleotidase [Cyclobacteriaceae bacterium]|nr:bifunctional metallophosphatase/5'-nucleotidase [Cyclobacteriaceae bacterium]
MNHKKTRVVSLLALAIAPLYFFLQSGCSRCDEKPVYFSVLQLNDVYEIAPLSGTDEGGMARVATIRDQLRTKDPRLLTVLAGDFVSPSFIGTLTVTDSVTKKSNRILGRQMVQVMNDLGVDLVTFGNHEFDIPIADLQKRIDESRFTWISSNVIRHTKSGPQAFVKRRGTQRESISPYFIKSIDAGNNKKVRVGFIGATLDFNKADSIIYKDVFSSVKETYLSLKDSCDVFIAVTHLDFAMDSVLARTVPQLNLIIGGHEHEHNYRIIGDVVIAKADANAKTVYYHRLVYHPNAKKTAVQSQLIAIDSKVKSQEAVDRTVKKWTSIAHELILRKGYQPDNKIYKASQVLDGREKEIRNHPTLYTQLIAEALLYSFPTADAALYNSGSLRLDDQLTGDVTEYDVLRSLPFGGAVGILTIQGRDLLKALEVGTVSNRGSGGYLQLANMTYSNGNGYINNQKIEATKTYKIAMPQFVANGKEAGLDFLAALPFQNSGVKPGIKNDIVDMVISYLKAQNK